MAMMKRRAERRIVEEWSDHGGRDHVLTISGYPDHLGKTHALRIGVPSYGKLDIH